MKIRARHITSFLVIIPFLIVFVAEIISFRHESTGASLKLLAILYMLMGSVIHLKFDRKIILGIVIFTPLFIYHTLISFNINAALEEGLRYLFPVIVLLYGYAVRKHYRLLINLIIAYALINNLYQPINYHNWLRGANEQWFYFKAYSSDSYYYNATMGVIRAVGLIGFFAAYGFMNLIAFFLTKQFYFGRHKKLILIVLVFGLVSSLSFKALGAFVLLLFFFSPKKGHLIVVGLTIATIALLIFPQKVFDFSDQIRIRVETYITEGNSARAESYRVMFNEIGELKLLGRGIGSFGGASSTKYDSPVYEEVNFNWYETSYLSTTDTFFPHVFVELGIIGGLSYFFILISPLMKKHYHRRVFAIIFVIYFSLFFDSLFSFALNNMIYLMLSLVLIYPILEFEKTNRISITK
jgi:hypothetical protein